MRHYKFPDYLSGSIRSYLNNHTISLAFDGETEPPNPFRSGLPQGSPLSPVLFILYKSTLVVGHLSALQTETCYIDDQIMTQGAQTTAIVRRELQKRKDERTKWAIPLKISFATNKCELMHMIPLTSKLNPNTPDESIQLYDQTIKP